jgi:hypothetical protein
MRKGVPVILPLLLTYLDMPWSFPAEWSESERAAWRAASGGNLDICLRGPGEIVDCYCALFDVDGDGDVDLRDWGANRPAESADE